MQSILIRFFISNLICFTIVLLNPHVVKAEIIGLHSKLLNPNQLQILTSNNQQFDSKLTTYFQEILSIPNQQDLWVNLSPIAPDRLVSPNLLDKEIGDLLLKQDLQLKQLTLQLLDPEHPVGKRFWQQVSLNENDTNFFLQQQRVWIVPGEIELYESTESFFILNAELVIATETDYLANKNKETANNKIEQEFFMSAFKEIILPELKQRINHDIEFKPLRQLYRLMILKSWLLHKLQQQELLKLVDAKTNSLFPIYQEYLNLYHQVQQDPAEVSYFNQQKQTTESKMVVTGGILPTEFRSQPRFVSDSEFERWKKQQTGVLTHEMSFYLQQDGALLGDIELWKMNNGIDIPAIKALITLRRIDYLLTNRDELMHKLLISIKSGALTLTDDEVDLLRQYQWLSEDGILKSDITEFLSMNIQANEESLYSIVSAFENGVDYQQQQESIIPIGLAKYPRIFIYHLQQMMEKLLIEDPSVIDSLLKELDLTESAVNDLSNLGILNQEGRLASDLGFIFRQLIDPDTGTMINPLPYKEMTQERNKTNTINPYQLPLSQISEFDLPEVIQVIDQSLRLEDAEPVVRFLRKRMTGNVQLQIQGKEFNIPPINSLATDGFYLYVIHGTSNGGDYVISRFSLDPQQTKKQEQIAIENVPIFILKEWNFFPHEFPEDKISRFYQEVNQRWEAMNVGKHPKVYQRVWNQAAQLFNNGQTFQLVRDHKLTVKVDAAALADQVGGIDLSFSENLLTNHRFSFNRIDLQKFQQQSKYTFDLSEARPYYFN